MRKVISGIIVIIFMLYLLPTTVRAQADRLVIDNGNIYVDMNKSYTKGYKPTVKDGKVTIVLPLMYEGTDSIMGDKIIVTPDLGVPGESPFSYANYQMNVPMKKNKVNDGKSLVSGFLVRLDIPLAADRVNGTYPVVINTAFSLKSGGQGGQGGVDELGEGFSQTNAGQVEQSFTVYVTITDGKDPTPLDSIPEPEGEPEPRPQPKIIVDEYEVDKEVIMAGEAFDVLVKLKNTEKTWGTKNIKVSYKGETDDILPASKSNTFYIDEIGKGKTHELTLHMKARQDAESKPQKILLTIEYEDSARTSFTVSEEILLEIRQPLRLEVDEINLPSTVNAGDSLPITTNIFNMGRSAIYNVRLTLEMPGVTSEGSAYLGKMEAGTSGSADIYAFFGSLDMGGNNEEDDGANDKSNMDKYGPSQGTMTITYEDEYGDEHQEIIDLSTNIGRPVFELGQDMEEESEEKLDRASQWWISIALAAGVIMLLFGGISYRRRVDRLKREYGDEDI